MPYTIVLTPSAEEALKYVEVSQTLFSDHQPCYLLNKDGTSSPHITVIQFESESLELARKVWVKMCEQLRQENFKPFSPPFTGVAFVEGVGPYQDTTWVELSVKRGGKDSPIMRVHCVALASLNEYGLKPLNACDNDYRPHLTLGRIIMPEMIKAWPKDLCKNPGEFNLEFGFSDEKWQYAKRLEIFS